MEINNPGSGNNIFIVIEGIDGSGKGSQVKNLQNLYFDLHKIYRILTTREPTYGFWGGVIRGKIENPDNMSTGKNYLELFTKDRKEHEITLWKSAYFNISGDNINVILMDRYMYSTFAYQQFQGESFETILNTQKEFIIPDLCIIVDVPIDVALSRMEVDSSRGKKEEFEDKEKLVKINEFLLKLPQKLKQYGHKLAIVDGNPPIKNVQENIDKVTENIVSVLKEYSMIPKDFDCANYFKKIRHKN